MKKYIPNILTLLRLFVTPIIIYLGINNHLIILIIVAIFIALTDFLDGHLARKWNVTSQIGAKLDMIADKVLALGLLILLIMKNNLFFYVLILEAIISLVNIYIFFKSKIANSLLIGKLKTWFLFVTIILGFINLIIPNLEVSITIFAYITIIIQIVTLYSYIRYYLKRKKALKDILVNM